MVPTYRSKAPWTYFNGSIAQLLTNNNFALILGTLPSHAAHKLRTLQLESGDDKWIWTGAKDGVVTAKSFFKHTQDVGTRSRTWSKIWKKEIPHRFSFLVWKIRHQVITVDSFLQQRGFPLASKCRCCKRSQVETMDHLFASSETANQVWSCLGSLVGVHGPFVDMKSLSNVWFDQADPRSQLGLSKMIAFGQGLWDIWKYRCAATFGEALSLPHPNRYKMSVLNMIKIRLNGFSPSRSTTNSNPASLRQTEILTLPKLKSASSLWRPADQGATANIARKGHLSAIILRSPDGRSQGAVLSRLVPLGHFQDLCVLINCAKSLAEASGVHLKQIQWDHDVAPPSSRKWAASSIEIIIKTIPRSANAAARVLLRHHNEFPLNGHRRLSNQQLPVEIYLMIQQDARML
uniref:Reverse transcriptase zinc-binding domain-containing protein n=1 Tax=Kalanchoe fedtschenkoi TaxID=63787 RepID=A0A7N0UL23_KALFE